MQLEHEAGTFPLFIHGHGAVSCAGTDSRALYQACITAASLPTSVLEREAGGKTIACTHRPVDMDALRLVMPKHPRLRRASNVTKYAVTAAHQAIGDERLGKMKSRELRIGIVQSFMNGCVNYTNRFFGEVLENPTLASPMVFPETVFNAPASHIAAYLECDGPVYTLIGDTATWFSALQVAEDWISSDLIDGCLIVAAEETDWLTLEALGLYSRALIGTEGAAAIYVEASPSDIRIQNLHGPFGYTGAAERKVAVTEAFSAIQIDSGILIDGRCGVPWIDRAEKDATSSWPGSRLSPAETLGESMGVRYGFQTVAAVEALRNGHESATVFAAGGNQHAFSALLTRST